MKIAFSYFRSSLLILTATLLFSCGKELPNYPASSWTKPVPQGEVDAPRSFPNVDSLVRTAGIMATVHSSVTRQLREGLTETDMDITLSNGKNNHLYIMAVDLKDKNISMKMAVPGNPVSTPATWPHKTLTDLAAEIENDSTGVAGMVNADFWDTSTMIPRGAVISDGKELKRDFQPAYSKQGISFVGVKNDGSMVIDNSSAFGSFSKDLAQACGSGIRLVKYGRDLVNSTGPDTDREPRTAVGYTADNYAFLLCVDGRYGTISEGMTMDDMGSIFHALKCREAVNLDGGGSTQMLRSPGAGVYEICNRPSDGTQRPVANAWAVVYKKSAGDQPAPALTIRELGNGLKGLLAEWENGAAISVDTSITIGIRTLKLNEIWELAAIGIMNMVTREGASVFPEASNVPVHTLDNGVGLDSALPAPSFIQFGLNPWLENGTLSINELNPMRLEPLVRLLTWQLKKGPDVGNIPNYSELGNYGIDGFSGQICAIRTLVIMARFYKDLLDGDVSSGVYTYMKDRAINPDLP